VCALVAELCMGKGNEECLGGGEGRQEARETVVV